MPLVKYCKHKYLEKQSTLTWMCTFIFIAVNLNFYMFLSFVCFSTKCYYFVPFMSTDSECLFLFPPRDCYLVAKHPLPLEQRLNIDPFIMWSDTWSDLITIIWACELQTTHCLFFISCWNIAAVKSLLYSSSEYHCFLCVFWDEVFHRWIQNVT